jgi:hypothetical protein
MTLNFPLNHSANNPALNRVKIPPAVISPDENIKNWPETSSRAAIIRITFLISLFSGKKCTSNFNSN